MGVIRLTGAHRLSGVPLVYTCLPDLAVFKHVAAVLPFQRLSHEFGIRHEWHQVKNGSLHVILEPGSGKRVTKSFWFETALAFSQSRPCDRSGLIQHLRSLGLRLSEVVTVAISFAECEIERMCRHGEGRLAHGLGRNEVQYTQTWQHVVALLLPAGVLLLAVASLPLQSVELTAESIGRSLSPGKNILSCDIDVEIRDLW